METHMLAYLKNRVGDLELDKAALFAENIALKTKIKQQEQLLPPKEDTTVSEKEGEE